MHNTLEITRNITNVQNLFLKVGYYLPISGPMDEIITFLENEPNAYRSLAYESAAFELAYHDLKSALPLLGYKSLYNRKGNLHPFHMQIGLGWAFAKAEVSPDSLPLSLTQQAQIMVYDGIGYYQALFKERRTLHNRIIPVDISVANYTGYFQGIGRRLWHIYKGDVIQLTLKIGTFDQSHHANLWRGVGLACGYVGGSDKTILTQLVKASGNHKNPLRQGIALAAYSRVTPNAVNPSIELACEIICGAPISTVIQAIPISATEFFQEFQNN